MNNQVVSQKEWLESQKALLAKEKAFSHQRDLLSEERQAMPWVKVEKDYVFDSPEGKKSLSELFGDKSQLVIYHFMFAPEWEQGCQSCSLVSDTIDGNFAHVTARDISMAVVSRAPIGKIEEFRKRMGWSFPWLSSFGGDFNYDFGVSRREQSDDTNWYNFGTSGHPSDEAPGLSVFYRNEAGEVFHTYSSYARGVEGLIGAYSLLDVTPKGRDEEGLSYPMAWVRHHDRYEKAQVHACCGSH